MTDPMPRPTTLALAPPARQRAAERRSRTPFGTARALLLAGGAATAMLALGCGKDEPPKPTPGPSASASSTKGGAPSTATATASAASAPSGSGAPSAEPPSSSGGKAACTLGAASRPLVVGKLGAVAISVWSDPNDGRVGVGLATGANKAVGFTVDIDSGASKAAFAKDVPRPVLRVVPYRSGDAISFAVDMDDPQATQKLPRSLPSKPYLKLGIFTRALVAATSETTAANVVWVLPTEDPVLALEGAGCGTQGAVVALRTKDAVWAGWVGADGKPAGSLEKLPEMSSATGALVPACNGAEAVLLFGSRAGKAEGTTVMVSRGSFGKPLGAPKAWAPPAGGPAGPVELDSVASLDKGRWLLSWLQGEPGSRELRLLAVDAALGPIGEPLVASPKGADAKGGTVAMGKGGGVLFLRATDGAFDRVSNLSLSCP
jgi:hypothetical protein